MSLLRLNNQMKKKRLVWFSAILLAGVMFFFENSAAALAVLMCVVFVPFFSIIAAALLRKRISVQLLLDKATVKNAALKGTVCVINKGFLPVTVYGSFDYLNMRTMEFKHSLMTIPVRGRKSDSVQVELCSAHCGKLKVRFKDIYLADAFGLTAFALPDTEETSVTVYPNCSALELFISDGGMSMMDSNRYSMHKAGNDPGETFAVREYIPGDMVRKIHWKLSQKTDKLMVREFGLPVINQILLLMETGAMGQDAQSVDAVTEMTVSLGEALVNAMQSYTLAWNNPETGTLVMRSIENENDFIDAVDEILALNGNADGATAAECFSREMNQCSYAHALVVSPAAQSMIRELYSGNRVTQFLPQNIAEGLQPDGTYMVSFDNEKLTQMYQIEV